jgi:hypothetical protein
MSLQSMETGRAGVSVSTTGSIIKALSLVTIVILGFLVGQVSGGNFIFTGIEVSIFSLIEDFHLKTASARWQLWGRFVPGGVCCHHHQSCTGWCWHDICKRNGILGYFLLPISHFLLGLSFWPSCYNGGHPPKEKRVLLDHAVHFACRCGNSMVDSLGGLEMGSSCPTCNCSASFQQRLAKLESEIRAQTGSVKNSLVSINNFCCTNCHIRVA